MSLRPDAVDRPVRFALVGAGRIGQTYVEAFQNARSARLAAVCDVRESAAQLLAEPLNIPAFTEVRTMLSDVQIDAVVIATPPATHKDYCLYFLSNEVDVLCEKPVCLDSDSAHTIQETARAKSRLFTMASKFRYVDEVVRAKSLLASGVLGEIVLFENTFASRVDMTDRWNSVPAVSGGGVLIDNGTHSVDLMRYFLGPLQEINVTEARRVQGLGVEETVNFQVRSVSGALASCDLSWSISKNSDSYISIYGTQGTLQVGWQTSSFHQHGNSSWVRFGSGYDKVRAFQHQLENFAGAICGLEKLLITVEDAVASVVAINAGYAAMREGRWCAITPGLSVAVAV